jgi:outer membrane immunogenic protein
MFKLVIAGALAAAAVPAFAQDAPTNFNGFFAGVQGGWQQDRQTVRGTVGTTTLSATNKNDGFAYGGQVGYDARLGDKVVLGVEAALTGRTGRGTLNDGTTNYTLRQGRTIDATARLGYLVDPQGLLYVRGGYSNARFNLDDGTTRDGANRGGYKVGAGYERLITQNVSARLEYDYSGYGSEDLTDFTTGVVNAADVKFGRHAVTAGVNFRF